MKAINSFVPAYLLLSAVAAQNNSTVVGRPKNQLCYVNDNFANGYNASGSVSYPGPRVNDSYPESTWTWSRYVTHTYNMTSNETIVFEAIDVKTTPSQNITDTNTFPFTGCYIYLGLTDDKASNAKDDGTCNTVLSSACVKDIIKHVNSTAQAVAGSYMGNSTYHDCTDLTRGLIKDKDSPCWQKWSGTNSRHFLPDSSRTANATNNGVRTCPSVDPASDPSSRNIWASGFNIEEGPNNFTTYDEALRNPQPLIVATWLKEKPDRIDWQQGYNFVDTKLVCIPANATTPNSRTVAEALKTGAASAVVGSRSATAGAALLILAFGLVL
ncbi:hypothetical protein VTL71DRAFT_10864 [Oculimacula yallundae]|uniref:Uncharacterized protein n=1 Tax=Oculimacula yallundae TaxID=86028 RepID=A0ABR4CW04_9HELO